MDDQPLVRAGLRMVFEPEAGVEIVGEAADGEQAARLAASLRPDVVLMDVRMPRVDGIQATRAILSSGGDGSPAARVLVLTTFDHDEYVYEALRAGASGFLLKDAPPEALVAAVRGVAAGDALLAPSITRRLIEGFAQRRRPPAPGLADLTDREREVFRLVARGLSNAETAERLHVGESTVKTHVGHVLAKLEVRGRVQAVVLAYEAGVVEPGT